MASPLKGLRILESALQYPGPYCCMLLADLGAEVIKIERPGIGDPARQLPHFFQSINRNKKSLTLNMKIPAARQILYRLVSHSDVFTEGFRPGVVTRLGMDYETLSKINPGLVYCSISGYGQHGPYRDMPGHDLNYQAMSGMLQCFKDNEETLVEPKLAIGDLSSSMFAALGILATLMGREKTGKGQYVDVSMFDGLLSWMSTHFGVFFGTGQSEETYDAGYGIFRGQDGKAFTLGIAYEDWFWDRLCVALGLSDLQGISSAERKERRDELTKKLQEVFSEKTREKWFRILRQADVPVAPVNTLKEVAQDAHVAFRHMIQPVQLSSGETHRQIGFPIKLSHMPNQMQTPAPELGEHTKKILKEIGYGETDIQAFTAEGAI